MIPLTLIALTIIALLWMLTQPARRRRRHDRTGNQPLPASWRQILRHRMPYYRRLPFNLQRQLHQRMHVFIAEKNFIGCNDLDVTDEMRVLIAAQACLLLLNRQTDCYPNLSDILIYPEPFVVEQDEIDEANVVHRVRRPLSGESWANSRVVLSWIDVIEGASNTSNAHNVVLHEFAHQLDQESGYGNGAPSFTDAKQAGEWSAVLNKEFSQLQESLNRGEPTLLDPYGAQNPAEFFAVATETFFERPIQMRTAHPLLYEELTRFYCVSPVMWED